MWLLLRSQQPQLLLNLPCCYNGIGADTFYSLLHSSFLSPFVKWNHNILLTSSAASMSQPSLSSSLTTARWPSFAAQCSAVVPSWHGICYVLYITYCIWYITYYNACYILHIIYYTLHIAYYTWHAICDSLHTIHIIHYISHITWYVLYSTY